MEDAAGSREMFVALAPGMLDLEALGALAPTSSAQVGMWESC